MYEERDKDGNIIGWRITKRIKNLQGKYDLVIARSKISQEDCEKQLQKKLKEYAKTSKEKKSCGKYSPMPLGEFADQWYKLNMEHANCTEKNKSDYRGIIYKKIIPAIGHIPLAKLTEDDCQRFLNSFEGLSKAYIGHVRMTLRQILKKAVTQRLIPLNPAQDIVMPKHYEGKRRAITNLERALTYTVAEYHESGIMFITMLHTGLRPIEIQRLKWEDIDFNNNILTVVESKTDAGEGRILPIDSYLREKLLEHKTKRFGQEYVFGKPMKPNEPHDGNSFYHAWKNFRKEMDKVNGAKFYRNKLVETTLADDLEPYLYRHTFCTDCQTAGIPINVAKEYMGHADISVTSKIYTHMVDEVFDANAKRLEEYHEASNNKITA